MPRKPPTPPSRFAPLATLACLIVVTLILLSLPATSPLKRATSQPAEWTVKDLAAFNFDQQNGTADGVPATIRQLDGQRIAITGKMWAGGSDASLVTVFDVTSAVYHSFQPNPPQVQQFVKCNSTLPQQYLGDLDAVRATGVFHVDVRRGPEGVEQVFRMDVERVEPANQPTTVPASPTAVPTTRSTIRPQTWYLFSFAFTLPALAISMYVRHRLRQRNRPVTGRCLTCGQEFKGVIDQCPQCGSTFLEQYSTKDDAE